MNRAIASLTIRSIDEDQRVIRGVATDASIDRVGDSIDPLGVRFPAKGVPLLWQHSHEKPVGWTTFDKPTKDGVTFEAKLPHVSEPGAFKEMVDLAWAAVKASVVQSVSIGFRPIPGAFEPIADGGIRYREIEVLELSLVSVPALPSARILEAKGHTNRRGGVVRLDNGRPKGGRVVKLTAPVRGKEISARDWAKRIREAKPGELSAVIAQHRAWIIDHGPIADAIKLAKAGAELRRVIARSKRQRADRVVSLTASERRLADFTATTRRYGR